MNCSGSTSSEDNPQPGTSSVVSPSIQQNNVFTEPYAYNYSTASLSKPRKRKFIGAKIQPSRVKKIMQSDEDIGRMMASVPVAIGRAMEHFCEKFLETTLSSVTSSGARTMAPCHMKHAASVNQQFNFLSTLMEDILPPKKMDLSGGAQPANLYLNIGDGSEGGNGSALSSPIVMKSPIVIRNTGVPNPVKSKRGRPKKIKAEAPECGSSFSGGFGEAAAAGSEAGTSKEIIGLKMDESIGKEEAVKGVTGEMEDANQLTGDSSIVEDGKKDIDVTTEENLVEMADANPLNQQSEPESFRLKILHFPKNMNHARLKVTVKKALKEVKFDKLKFDGTVCYINVYSSDCLDKALCLFNNMTLQGNKLYAEKAAPQPDSRMIKRERKAYDLNKDVRDIVTPLHHLSYEQQLEQKQKDSKKIMRKMMDQMRQFGIDSRQMILSTIKESPKSTGYRNKNEFNIGLDKDGKVCVGVTGGRLEDGRRVQLPIDTCMQLSKNTMQIVKVFEAFIVGSGVPIYDEVDNSGFWKMLTVKDFAQDTMVTITTYPQGEEFDAKLGEVKNAVIDKFFGNLKSFENQTCHVTSLYWQVSKESFDPKVYEHIAGTPFVYETLLDTKFRLGPASFFQTNSFGAAVLFETIMEFAGMKVLTAEETEKNLLLLDICCGAGAISLCIFNNILKNYPTLISQSKVGAIGVEIVPEAIEDAHKNAFENGISSNMINFVAGSAEIIFRNLKHYCPEKFAFSQDQTNVVGILDPPRAGMNDKLIISLRKLDQMKKLVYVSCDPKAAQKNLIDLCRVTSKKYEGEPFVIKKIQPVDMFPQTVHFEWVVLLERE
uniref:tRNA (uracil(54)-C(5))-methyltransferase n=1 Tax=Rhabditophanes sp. KR3021 TaxID=114890 RepID=A0AC35TG28_9BILA